MSTEDKSTLTQEECSILRELNQSAINLKARMFDLRAEFDLVQQRFNNCVTVLAVSHGLSGARVSSDLTRLIPAGEGE